MNDGILVAKALAGDNDAFASLVETHQLHVFNLAYRMLGRREDAEDAAQETFLRAYRQLSTYRPEQRFTTWLLAICAHYCVDQLRRRRIDWIPLDEGPERLSLASREPQPEEAALARERSAEVMALLRCLAPKYRLVTLLFYSYEMSVAEIARATSTSEGAVKTQLCRARDMLAAQVIKDRDGVQLGAPTRTRTGYAQDVSVTCDQRQSEQRQGVMARAV